MPRLQHELDPLTVREHDDPGYFRYSILTASGSGHLAEVACYDQHPDNEPAAGGRSDPRAYGHAVLFAHAARMYHLLHGLLSYIPPDDDLPDAAVAAAARALLAAMEAGLDEGAMPSAPADQSIPAAGAALAWVLRDLLEALPPMDPASEFHGDDADLSRAELMEVLPGIGTAARAAIDRWEAVGGGFIGPREDRSGDG
jgi:hypothetical protein